MLQTLLKERFKLVAHREMREQTIYSLINIKDPPRLTPMQGNGESGVKVLPIPGQTSAVQVVGKNMTMQHLADVLGSQLRGPVHDQTGLTGSFDFAFTLDKPPDAPGGAAPDLTFAIVTRAPRTAWLETRSTQWTSRNSCRRQRRETDRKLVASRN
jgi:uncharacterized protein (TIGR03435 family)